MFIGAWLWCFGWVYAISPFSDRMLLYLKIEDSICCMGNQIAANVNVFLLSMLREGTAIQKVLSQTDKDPDRLFVSVCLLPTKRLFPHR